MQINTSLDQNNLYFYEQILTKGVYNNMSSKISAISNILKLISTLFEFIATELRPNMTAIVINVNGQHDAGIITSHNGCQN